MKQIIIFKDNELALLDVISEYLGKEDRQSDINLINSKRTALEGVARSISIYPSINDSVSLGGSFRNINTLVRRLCDENGRDLIFNMPTKAILGKSYLVAKLNYFYMISYIISDSIALLDLRRKVYDILKNIVFTLMAEEVFVEILIDKQVSVDLKEKAAIRLTKLWEFRLDHGVSNFAPSLENIWGARGALSPVYGTFLGASELMQLSTNLNPKVSDFFEKVDFSEDLHSALEEFLFGLTFEELLFLRKSMNEMGRNSLSDGEIRELLSGKPTYMLKKNVDPRDFYSFFITRNNNSKFRLQAETSGPKKTLEEHLMLHLLAED
ncbi:MAG: hypothetical protein SCALA702_16670 [Melioribacteraceae bacterium]|nr:MAG: hypothetical protein SCALA702_16670 [Melioribacteraceae bacterium]